MASVNGVPIDDLLGTAGAAFDLGSPSRVDFTYEPDQGSWAVLSQESSALIVSFAASALTADPDRIHLEAYSLAQETLDMAAMRSGRFLALPEADLDSIIWWSDTDGTHLRMTAREPYSFNATGTVAVTHADGSVTSAASLPSWEESMRYLRYSQITDNIYDAYRTAYLALEALLSKHFPKRQTEGDRAWNSRACHELEAAGFSFATFVDNPISGDLVEDFIEEQYVANRCAQDHAKLGSNHYLPGVLEDRTVIQVALFQLCRFVRAAIGQLLSHNYPGSTFSLAGIETISSSLAELQLHTTSDPTLPDTQDTLISPGGYPVSDLQTSYLAAVDDIGYDFGWEGKILVASMADRVVRCVAGTIRPSSTAPPILYNRLRVPEVDVTGATVFEYRQIHYWSNNGGIRRHYPL